MEVAGLSGTYLSVELGALATVTSGAGSLTVAVGAAEPQALSPVYDDLLRTSSYTVRLERDGPGAVRALLLSGGRMRGVRVDAAPGTTAVGFPVSLGGPVPAGQVDEPDR